MRRFRISMTVKRTLLSLYITIPSPIVPYLYSENIAQESPSKSVAKTLSLSVRVHVHQPQNRPKRCTTSVRFDPIRQAPQGMLPPGYVGVNHLRLRSSRLRLRPSRPLSTPLPPSHCSFYYLPILLSVPAFSV